jgi:sodium transport system permease protein
MRWPIVRLIAGREIRDQLRDRRTLFLILGLPILMYPLFVGVGLLFAAAIKDKKLVVGVRGAKYLPQRSPAASPPAAAVAAGVPGAFAPGIVLSSSGPAGAAALAGASEFALHYGREFQFPPLIVGNKFPEEYLSTEPEGSALEVNDLDKDDKLGHESDEVLLAGRKLDAILIVPDDLEAKLERGESRARPTVQVKGREGEENSKLAVRRLTGVLKGWAGGVKSARFARLGLPADFDSPVEIKDPLSDKPPEKKMFDELRDMLVKVIPFLLVMWMLTGSIYPAIDMTAGEKERGTMETLLISPAGRSEIVMGKFLAVVTMSFGTAIWNVLLMLVAVGVVQVLFPQSELLSFAGLGACVLASLPLAMLIAACALSLGVFARSTKEGNYYMVPMFFIVLPLGYWSMTPGMELNSFSSWVPLANALLLQQRLMAVRPDPFPWQHVPAVVISLTVCISLALWAAVRQFHRESVLFREAEPGARRKWSLFGRGQRGASAA